ncbi:histidine phosphatase family protein [Paramagnetospirillum magneticum]|uniref:Fructose-2,6-bisphosphatase n=1 Tax=Paramagnetospirillum magneticum (strain ATCC 700264 / AMB-1) TaxID=342108 RepID=Q2VYZ2_PARM1|nr:histidine phosphatase family protein [Paramagnetospirillum magneticum]BAE53183.1 Fructose-2,6-bisphosphatase [Paramagnetospirillum magneticum AMB-1]
MPTVILVRHGETVWNREGRVQGHGDSPLTPKGAAQARAYGRKLRQMLGDAGGWRVVSSPLGRCAQTTGILCEVAELDFRSITFDDRLREVHTGQWSGLPKAELAARHPGMLEGEGLDHWVFRCPGGESHHDVASRLAHWLADLAPGDKVIAVSHGIAGRVLRGLYSRLDPDLAMRGDSPQDVLFLMSKGCIERIGSE